MAYGKKKMMGGGRSSMDTGKTRQKAFKQGARALQKRMDQMKLSDSPPSPATAQRLGKASGGKMKYGHGGGVSGNAAARREGKAMGGAMKTSKPC